MKILCVTPWFPVQRGEQTGNFVLDSVEALVALGHQVSVLVTLPWRPALARRLRPEWRNDRPHAHQFNHAFALAVARYPSLPRNLARPFVNVLHDALIGKAIERQIARHRPDVIVGHTEGLAPVIAKIGRAHALPTTIILHGINMAERLQTTQHRAYIGQGLAHVDRIVVVGEPLVEHFAAIAGHHDHFRIVHNGFRPPVVPFALTSDKQAMNRFISVSNLNEGKGLEITLQALGKLLARGIDDWTYAIVGAGPERDRLEALTLQLGLSRHVAFIGAWPHADIYQQLGRADVFVLPSYREAFGIAYLEAMAAGLVAIGVAGQGPEAFIRSGQCGFLVPPRDVHSLCECLVGIVANPHEARLIAMAGQIRANTEFTWKQHGIRLTQVLGEICVP